MGGENVVEGIVEDAIGSVRGVVGGGFAGVTGVVDGAVGGCRHEVDEDSFPGWDPKLGKVWVCRLCGEKVFKRALYNPLPGKKVRMSKKERRRQRAAQEG
jgi:hypothetical protein